MTVIKNKLDSVNPEHVDLLTSALRSPSAHNAQPWKIRPLEDGKSYELHYDHNDYLPDDPDDRDAYLTMGAFVETLVLEAPNYGFSVNVMTVLTRDGEDLFVAKVEIVKPVLAPKIGKLNRAVTIRQTNRNSYNKDLIPKELEEELLKLGNTIVDPKLLKDVLKEASMKSWNNPRFVRDLKIWYRKDLNSRDGFSSPQMKMGSIDTIALKFAFWRGRLKSKTLESIYSSRDIAMFTSATSSAVISSDDMSPAALFDAGRRLLESWVLINSYGYAYHPFSIAIDEKSTAPKVAELTGVKVPVSLYRIGKATKEPFGSNRKKLEEVII